MELNRNIKLFPGRTVNTKASEEYVHVLFSYPDANFKWDGWVPVEYRRTGVSIPQEDKDGLAEHLNSVYSQMHPSKYAAWKREQDKYWSATRSVETKDIFYILADFLCSSS